MRALIASPLGLLVGLSLGALGGGGSILAVPALVHGVGETAQAATATSLFVVGAAAMIGILPHWRKGHVRFGSGVLFAVVGTGGSFVGTQLNHGVDGDLLMLLFSGFMVLAGVAMLRNRSAAAPLDPAGALVDAEGSDGDPVASCAPPVESVGNPRHGSDHAVVADAAAASSAGGVATAVRPASCEQRSNPARCRTIKVIIAGTVVGVLTGFFGVGGGFIIVPALVLTLGLPMPVAVGTSLVVIAMNSAIALGLRGGGSDIDWAATLPFLVMAAIGTVIGGRVAERVDPDKLKLAFVGLLAVVAVLTGATAAVAMAA